MVARENAPGEASPPPQPQPAAKSRRRLVMTKADWERVRRDVERAERNPDPAQQVMPFAEVASDHA